MKRAVVVFGAGASVEYGARSTGSLTHAVDGSVIADAGIKLVKADDAFKTIKAGLETYLENQGIVRFEHTYYCAHELISTSPPTAGAQTSSARAAELLKIFEQRRLRKIL
jgi:hypothetical protein